MMNDKVIKTRLKVIKLYPERDEDFGFTSYFIKAVYEVETDTEVKEIIIPKIDIGLRSNCLPGIDYVINRCHGTCDIRLSNGYTLPLRSTTFKVSDKDGNDVEIKDRLYAEVVKREKPKKMTIEEIEKALGHKVEIVSEKGE